MKRLRYVLVLAAGIAACTSPHSDKAKVTAPKEEAKNVAGEKYVLNTQASKMEWMGSKVTGFHTGSVRIKSGELMVSDGKVTAGDFVMDMPTLVASGPQRVSEADSKKLTGHLRSSDFFDVQKFPEAKFVITSVKPFSGEVKEPNNPQQEQLSEFNVANPTHKVSGNLTIKDVTHNIEFPARITIDDKGTLEAMARFNINRKDWGVIYPGQPDDLIRDDIHFGIYLRADKRGEPLSKK